MSESAERSAAPFSMAGSEPQAPPAAVPGPDDRALPYQVEALEVRGRVVTLGPAIDTILSRHDFPRPVTLLLGEAVTLAALLSTSLKDIGRFILQTQTDGPVSMLVVDIRSPGEIRATASFDADAVMAASADSAFNAGALLGAGTLAMTIEQGSNSQRYQGFVPLDHEGLGEAAHTYFRQSEQIPTRIRLAVGEMFDRDQGGAARRRWRAGGIIAQFLPQSEERVKRRDLPAGNVPEGVEPALEIEDDDAWVEAAALVDTVEAHELTDPDIQAERLLIRLFHERGVRVFSAVPLLERCSCARERIERVLHGMSTEDLVEASKSGKIEVKCEFCGTRYNFDPAPFLAEAESEAEAGSGED